MTLDDPLRLHIQKTLSKALEEITVANGYKHDLEGRVFRGRGLFGDETPLPCVSILETPIPPEQDRSPSDSAYNKGEWELMIQGWVQDDRYNPTDPAHFLLADVKKRLAVEIKRNNAEHREDRILGLGDSILSMYVGSGVVRPPDELSTKAYFWLTVTLDIVEDLDNPYST